ncbi:unnamed protein product [Rodentolepis nana]|uniref:1-deoxy-D-xylulose-5-phosphate synthase n=1 Tax=Rodentolepis nana TaxID=102285 RepID=A0A0R3T198_RODNA|nr:unnamed protein product [Rodentolepis nana]
MNFVGSGHNGSRTETASHSIFDLRRYTDQGKLLPYMDVFPLPFYLVLRDVTALPQLLVEALRQWFELASATAEGSGSSLNGASS